MADPVIALLTDFGVRDTYVGELKGAILSINPSATIVDITHHILPQEVRAGAFLLGNAVAAFPVDTVFVVVVEPGVGSERRPMLVETPQGEFVGPDNGLLSRVIWLDEPDPAPSSSASSPLPFGVKAWRLTNPAYWRESISNTFHGRDIFAPAAAHYAAGVPASAMGEPATGLWRLLFPHPRLQEGVLTGEVIYVDNYGNLVTNIPARMMPPDAVIVMVAGWRIDGLSEHYDTSRPLVAIVGSHDNLEIAKPGGSAAEELTVGRGEPVRVTSARSP